MFAEFFRARSVLILWKSLQYCYMEKAMTNRNCRMLEIFVLLLYRPLINNQYVFHYLSEIFGNRSKCTNCWLVFYNKVPPFKGISVNFEAEMSYDCTLQLFPMENRLVLIQHERHIHFHCCAWEIEYLPCIIWLLLVLGSSKKSQILDLCK